MASEIRKEPSTLEAQSLEEVLDRTKLEDSEVSNDHNDLSGSEDTLPLEIVTPGSMDNCNQTFDVPDQIEISEDDGTSGHLSSHKLTHTRKKLFACGICGKGFRSKLGLRCHEKNHSEEQSVCALCGEPFRLLEDLEEHLKWHIQGDILVLIRGSNEHWCQGRVANDVRRKDGFVPLSYVELVDPKRWESSTSRDPSSSGHSSNSGSSSDKVLRSGVVLFDIVGQVECELTLKQGDVVVIHESIPPDGFWLRGECNGRMGMLPSTVIEFISQPSPKESMSSLNDTDIVHDVLTNGNQAFTPANQASSSDIFSSSSSVQPVMESTDDGQTNLDCLDNPESSMVQEESTPSCSTPPLPPLPLSPVPPLERAKVLFTFMAEMPGEISLKRGEIVEVTRSNSDDHQDGWVWVRLADGRTGMAPKNFLELTRTLEDCDDISTAYDNDFIWWSGQICKVGIEEGGAEYWDLGDSGSDDDRADEVLPRKRGS
ncbi:unnamed protein product [Cyprideis torosa]|uniref:Uncharacterized protein n=1 Tax=Cyprideis torosa TaxID=163714 RepID=A0A7R8W086_9CRUS|nr:unnamed protein product [Cyprideis torosa]CAG0879461.1 unnamed protein product [Cyprideis torosa]